MIRQECAICQATSLDNIYILKQFPLCQSSTTQEFKNDLFGDIEIVSCRQCGCVQHKTLVEPSFLYENAHNLTYTSPTWAKHHDLFSEFILDQTSSKNIVEVGGYSGVLARKILEKKKVSYTIVDLCDIDPKIPNVNFCHGNCEEIEFEDKNTIVLSHTFEHLYRPADFVKNISKQNMNEIFLSLPNLEQWIEKGAISALHIEHTFFYDRSMIVNLFKKFGYRLNKIKDYLDHSLFFYFVKENMQLEKIIWNNPSHIIDRMNLYFKSREKMFHTINIQTPFFIFPAGHFGQMTYYYLNRFEDLLLGFLDNDQSKINKRVYGTKFSTYHPRKLLEYSNQPITVLISAAPYIDEIKKQIEGLHTQCTVLKLDMGKWNTLS